jgi:hypothetical protein
MSYGKHADANKYSGVLYRPQGPAYNEAPWDSSKVVMMDVGTGTLEFTDNDHGTFTYSVDGISQSKPITRYVFAKPGTVCREGG